ncbi:MAG: response regulator [Nitrospirae bacterium]|nr:response regulator [Nitrospirota bacterium]
MSLISEIGNPASTILVVDDDPFVLESVSALLEAHGYSVTSCSNANDAINRYQKGNIDVILTDVKMPRISGLELLKKIREINTEVPVILMTAYAEIDMAIASIKNSAFDFIIKPYNAEHLMSTIEKAVKYNNLIRSDKDYKYMLENTVEQRTRELANALTMIRNVSKEMIQRLTAMAEFRDTDTGAHTSRIGLYSNKIAEALNMSMDFIDNITFAGQMHDIGKIGIPDNILLKPGRLTDVEFKIMKKHTLIGEKVLSGSSHENIKMAASIALNHHERWDGTGYPGGLKGTDIPFEGRIVMICDQYDALRCVRPYKPALSHQEAFKTITQGDGRTMPEHFDPSVLKGFIELSPVFDDIFNIYK